MDVRLPRDDDAERGFIGCLCETASCPEWFDPIMFFDDGRRALFVALDMLRAEGLLYNLEDPTNAGLAFRVSYANAELCAAAIDQAGTWPNCEPVRVELNACMDCCTCYWLCSHYAERIRRTWERRQAILEAQGALRGALLEGVA